MYHLVMCLYIPKYIHLTCKRTNGTRMMEGYSSTSLCCVNRPCVYTFIRTYIHTCIQTYIQTYIHTYMHAYVCISVYVYIACWTIVRAVRAVEFKGMCDGVYICTYVLMHVYICMCLHENMYINSLIHIHVSRIIYTHIHPPTLSVHPAHRNQICIVH